ncbi:MlaD family protein [Fluviicola chungangensis]|uniref:MCE family protein n=1 Tax=Fluviicola chungangensis TaxID=2597671 RepID=A0A556MMS8_9FLAO|nr:MlaD family protein [Fluviicola chungangensis]TSJ41185.1 MCE family protein [Fluviicola chungangensis]
MKYLFFFFFFTLILFSCSNDPKRDLVILFEETNGLDEGDDVILKKREIGKVTKIEFSDEYQMAVHIHLEEINRLPRDSKFIIGKDGIFSHAIYVIPGKSKTYLSSKDKITGKAVKEIDWGKEFNDLMDESFRKPAQTQDSVLDELRDIKHEIHEVNEKTK